MTSEYTLVFLLVKVSEKLNFVFVCVLVNYRGEKTDYKRTSVTNAISVEKDGHVLLYWFYYKYYYNRSILHYIK